MDIDKIIKYLPNFEAIEYFSKYDSFESAWANCNKGSWMLMIAGQLGVDPKLLTLAKCRCAETVKHLMKDQRSLDALQACMDFYSSKIGIEELNEAARKACSALIDSFKKDGELYAYTVAAASAYDAANIDKYSIYLFPFAPLEHESQASDICRQLLTSAVFIKLKIQTM